jgi:hypothetical protein
VPEAHNKYENIVLQIPITNYEDVDNEVFLLGFEVTDFKEKINLEITKNEVYLSSVKVFLRKPLTLKISSVQLQIILSRKKGTIHSMTYRAENFNLSISAIPCMDNADTFLFQSGLKGFSQPFDPQLVIKTPAFKNYKEVFTSSLFSNIHHHHIFQPFPKA